VTNDMRDAWRSQGGPPHHRGPSPSDVRVTGAPAGRRFPFGTVFGLALLGGIGWAVWKYHGVIIEKFHVTTDAENAAEAFIHKIPSKAKSELFLEEAAKLGNSDALTVHSALKTRWFVAYAPLGSEEKPRILRDDGFRADAHGFFTGVLLDPASGAPATGLKRAPKPSALSASWRNVKLEEDSRPWRVIVGWSEKPAE
jgi:hypothetical protein